MTESTKERWQEFFEQAKEEYGLEEASPLVIEGWFDILAERADELLIDDEGSRTDAAYEQWRDTEWSTEP